MSKDSTYTCRRCGDHSTFPFFTEEIRARCPVCERLTDHDRVDVTEPEDADTLFEEAQWIVEDRENQHGDIVETHRVIAEFWSTYLTAITGHDIDLNASHSADMLDLFKDARKATGERDRDTYRDGIGYNHCGWTCREAEMDEDEDV